MGDLSKKIAKGLLEIEAVFLNSKRIIRNRSGIFKAR